MSKPFWCEALKPNDKVIVKSISYYDIPRVTQITRVTKTQVFLLDGPNNREWAFWKRTGYQVAKKPSLPLQLFESTKEAERDATHRQRINAVLNCAHIRLDSAVKKDLTHEQVCELYECFVRLGLIEKKE